MHAHGIAQVEPPSVGIHLIWTGPRPWLYSPHRWSIQRRVLLRDDQLDCEVLHEDEGLPFLRAERERRLRFGTVTLREGAWPSPVVSPSAPQPPPSCDVLMLELDETQPFVLVSVQARSSFAFVLRDGKAVAIGGPPAPGEARYQLNEIAIDTVVVYALELSLVEFCIRMPAGDEEQEWANATRIVENLQLPLKELMPALNDGDDEYEEARSRLLPGEELDRGEFDRLADALRAGVTEAGPPRPIDQVLLMRENLSASFEEMVALDPIRVLLSHPRWRRVLGFGWFDDDPSLAVGTTYEYRITGHFPAEDLADAVYGFHTIPSRTALPAEFYLRDLRLRRAQPTTVERAPDTPEEGSIQISRRGIWLRRQTQDFWLLPSLEDWSLVIDFPSPVSSVILELHKEHNLEYVWVTTGGALHSPDFVPQGPRPRLDFPSPVEQLRLRGEGFLFAIRIPAGPVQLVPVSMVLPPIELRDTPRPEPPLLATVGNLQQPRPVPADDTPPDVPPRHSLGFEVRWRPALRDGLEIWPHDERAAPPLAVAIYQLEHRRVVFPPSFPVVILAATEESRAAPSELGLLAPRISRASVEDLRRVYLPGPERRRLLAAVVAGDLETIMDVALESVTAWEPVLPEENWTLGDRDETVRDTAVYPGVDLMSLFPETPRRAPDAGLDIYWRDVFDFEEGATRSAGPYHLPAPTTSTACER